MLQLFTLRHHQASSRRGRVSGLILMLMLLFSIQSIAQSVIWTNPITGTNPNTSNPYIIGQSVAPGITVSGIGRGSGINGTNANNRYTADGWSTGAIDLNDYFEFVITPLPGTRFTLSSFTYTGQRSGTGTTSTHAVRTNAGGDNFSTNVGSPSAAGTTINFTGTQYQNLNSAITIRFYTFAITAATTTYSINDFSFNGSVIGASGAQINTTTGNGTNVTHRFNVTPSRSSRVFTSDHNISVSGFTPTGYNNSNVATSAITDTTIQYANTNSSAVTVFGTVQTTRTFTGMDYNNGGPSSASAVRASATGMNPATSTITVYAPENGAQYEVSTTSSSSGFGTTATFSAASALADATVWVRLKSGLSAGTYTGNVGIMGGGMNTPQMTTTGASGTGTTATITFATQSSAPYAVGDVIVVSGVSPSGYNGAYTVTAATTSSVSYASAETGVYFGAGTVNRATTLATVSGTVTIGCTAPTQASGLTLSTPTVNGLSATWTSNGGDGTMVVVRPTAQSNATPTNGTSYTANTDYATAGQINANNRVVFRASGTSASVTAGLSPETQYTVSAYAYNNAGDCYALTSVPSANIFTLSNEPSAHPASFTVTGTTPTSLTLGFSAANTLTHCDGYLLLRRNGATPPSGLPSDATAYSVSGTIGDGTVEAIITSTSQTSITINSLTPGSSYSYMLVPYNWNVSNAGTYNYLTSGSPLTLTGTTNSVSVPVVTSPTKTTITNSSAVLGGNVTSNGGDALTAVGIVWSYTDNTPEVGEAGVDTAQTALVTGVFTRTISSLNFSSRIYFRAYATNSQGTGYTATDSFSTLANTPTVAASLVTFTAASKTDNSLFLASVTNGDGANRIMVIRPNASTRVAPTNGVAYTANSLAFNDGLNPTTGTNNVVIANGGTFSNLTITGLNANTSYAVDVYEQNGSGDSSVYFYAVTATSSLTTLAAQPATPATNVVISGISPTQATISWTAGAGTNHLVVVKASAPVDGVPVDGTSYTASQAFGSGSAINTNNFVVYRATLNNITINTLTDGTTYHVAVYTYNGTAGSGNENYLTTSVPTASFTAQIPTFYSVAGQTNPNAVSSWNSETNGTGSAPADFTSNALRLIIQSGHSMTTSSAWTFGTSANSELRISTGATLTATSAITINNAASIFRIDSAGTYNHNNNSGTPATTIFNGVENFHAASNFNLNNLNSNNTVITTGVTLPFGNLTINWTTNTNSWQQAFSGTINLTAGNLTISSTGSSGNLRLTSGNSYRVIVGGNFTMTSGILDFASSASAPADTFQVAGNFHVTGGTFTRTGTLGSPSLVMVTGASNTFRFNATMNNSDRINWMVASGANYTWNGNIQVGTSRSLTLNGAVSLGDTTVISGAGSVIVNNSLRSAHPNGVNGNITATTKTFNSGSRIVYNGTVAQSAGLSGLNLTNINGITVENTSGAVSLDANLTLGNNDTITVNSNATLGLQANTVTFGTGGAVIVNGTIRTQNLNGLTDASNSAIVNTNSPTLQLNAGSTVIYNAASGTQTVSARSDYQNLTLGGGATKSLAGNITLAANRSLTLDAGTALTTAGNTITLGTTGTANLNGTLTLANLSGFNTNTASAISTNNSPTINLGNASTIEFAAASGTQTVDSRSNYRNLTFSGNATKQAAGNISLQGNWSRTGGAFDPQNFTVTFNGSTANQTVNATGGAVFNNLTLNNTFTNGKLNASSNITVNGALTLTQGELNISTNTLALNGSVAYSAGTVDPTSGTISFGTPYTVDLALFPLFNNLTVAADVTLSGTTDVYGALNCTAGDLILDGRTLNLYGSFSGSAANALRANGSGNVNVVGSGSVGTLFFDQTTAGTTNRLANLTLNRSNQTAILGNELQLTGLLTSTAGTLNANGNLTMISNATQQAMVAFGGGSVSGNVTAQRYISGINNAWRGFSAPVGATYSDISASINLGTQGQNGSNLIALRDLGTNLGGNWIPVTNWRIAADTNINATMGGTITAGRGFLAYGGASGIADLTSPVTLDLTGSLNSSVIAAPGRVGSTKPYNGWMLMGNPYLATLDWENMYGTADVANLNATIYLYNTTYGSWDSYNAVTNTSTGSGTNLIAPFQAFMVKASNATVPTLNFRTSQTSTAASTYNFRQQNNFPIVRLQVKKNNVQVQTALTLVAAQATSGLDADYDAQYPGSFNGHEFYSMTTGDYKLQQNSRPMPAAGISEPYYFEYNGTGNYSIASLLENIDPMWNVYLEDKITNTMHNLRNGSYNFTHQATNRKDRFVLHLNALTTSVNEVSNDHGPIVSMENGSLNIRFGGEAASRKLEVVDLSGKVLRTVMMANTTQTTIDLSDLSQAVYLLRATGNGTTSVTKFVNIR